MVHFSSPTRVGSQTLPPAEYKVYCEHTNGRHQLVFIRMQDHSAYGILDLDETSDITKVPCRMDKLKRNASRTELHLARDDTGQQYVIYVLIRGENVRHALWRSEPLRPVQLPNGYARDVF